jgi:surfeit locus 1 family protein
MTRRAWAVWLAASLAIAGTARLGWWQLDRAAQKIAAHEARQRQSGAPALTLAELPGTSTQAQSMESRRVVLAGRWLAAKTVFLDNRPMAGRTGFFVLTPLMLEPGAGPGTPAVVLVQRGWWPRDARDRTRIAAPEPATGLVTVAGRLALSASRLFALGPDAAGTIRQNLELDAFARETGLALWPWVLVQVDAQQGPGAAPIEDGLLRQWPEPSADVHKHYGYAFQWFALAALLTGLLLWFQVLRLRPRRSARPPTT